MNNYYYILEIERKLAKAMFFNNKFKSGKLHKRVIKYKAILKQLLEE